MDSNTYRHHIQRHASLTRNSAHVSGNAAINFLIVSPSSTLDTLLCTTAFLMCLPLFCVTTAFLMCLPLQCWPTIVCITANLQCIRDQPCSACMRVSYMPRLLHTSTPDDITYHSPFRAASAFGGRGARSNGFHWSFFAA